MKARQRRLLAVLLGLGALGLATALVLRALGDNVMFFFSPTQIAAAQAPRDAAFRLGGLVEPASLHRDAGDSLTVRFVVTDQVHRVPVRYRGVLPDLFKEGKGVVVAGRLREDGAFVATQVLAKHDENYMPPEAAAALDHARQAGATGGGRRTGGVAADSPALVPGAAP